MVREGRTQQAETVGDQADLAKGIMSWHRDHKIKEIMIDLMLEARAGGSRPHRHHWY